MIRALLRLPAMSKFELIFSLYYDFQQYNEAALPFYVLIVTYTI